MLYALILQVVRAAEVTNMRGGRFMSVEDIIFLMRKDKVSGGVMMDGMVLWTLLNLTGCTFFDSILAIFLLYKIGKYYRLSSVD